jgi:hypothetical protein
MDELLAGFGGVLSDDDTPTKRAARKDKGKEKAGPSPKKARPKPKPFPLNAKSVRRFILVDNYLFDAAEAGQCQQIPAVV